MSDPEAKPQYAKHFSVWLYKEEWASVLAALQTIIDVPDLDVGDELEGLFEKIEVQTQLHEMGTNLDG